MNVGGINDRVTQEVLSGLAGKLGESPIARMGIRYWWLSLPIGFAMYSQFLHRKEKGEATTFHLLQDFGTLIGPIATLVALNEFARKEEEKKFGGPIKEAQFTQVPQQQTGVP